MRSTATRLDRDRAFYPIVTIVRRRRAWVQVTIKDCGHFAHLECAGDVRNALDDFFRLRKERR